MNNNGKSGLPLRILHVISSMDPEKGGVCQAVRLMIKGLAANGITSEVACLDAPDMHFPGTDPFVIHALGPGKTSWYYNKLLGSWLKQNLGSFSTVIVHGLWQYHTFATLQAWKREKNKGIKLFVMPHGMLDPYFQKATGRRLKAIRNEIVWRLIESKLVNNADVLLFTCSTELNLAPQAFKTYKPKRTCIVGLGLEDPPAHNENMKAKFEESVGQLRKDEKFFLFLGRIHPKKGVDLLVEAYVTARNNGKDLLPLVIAGPGLETGYGQKIKAAATGHPVFFPGMLSGAAKWGAFYESEVFVLPSHQENFGIAVAEALACSRPVLISDKVNIWNEISKGQVGLVEKDDAEGVSRLLTAWADISATEKKEKGLKARKVFEEEFSINEFAARMLALIHEGQGQF